MGKDKVESKPYLTLAEATVHRELNLQLLSHYMRVLVLSSLEPRSF